MAAAALGLVAEALAVATYAAGRGVSLPDAVRLGGVLFYWFHHVPMVFQGRVSYSMPRAPEPSDVQLTMTLSMALMLGSFLAMWLLFRAGRGVANLAGGTGWARGLHGLKVAAPYAAICFGAAWLVRFTVAIPPTASGSGRLSAHPSYVGAALWPLSFAAVAGWAGGFLSSGRASRVPGASEWRIRSALQGGWAMLLAGLLLALGGVLALGAANPEVAAAYFRGVAGGGPVRALTLTGLSLLAAPNAAAWALFPSMGSCLGVYGGGASLCLLSYGRIPTFEGTTALSGLEGIPLRIAGFEAAPQAYVAFLLVPLIAVLVGGRLAAKRGMATSRGEAARIGALAGLAFGLLCVGMAVLATIFLSMRSSSLVQSAAGLIRIGPDLLSTGLLASIWGVLGGALGAAMFFGRRRRHISVLGPSA